MMLNLAGPAAAVVADGTTEHTEENTNKTGCSGKNKTCPARI